MKRFLLAQISDLHVAERGHTIWNGVDTAALTRGAVATLQSLDPAPDLVLISGDLTNDGRTESYEHAVSLLAPIADRLVVIPGNHDSLENLRAELPAAWFPASASGDFVVEGVPRLICLNTGRPPLDSGDLSASQLDWLGSTLAETDAPTIVALHHPPFPTGVAFTDAIALNPKAARVLAQIVRTHNHVELVACGHTHRFATRRWAGTSVVLAPAIASTIALDLRVGAVGAANEEPPALLLHEWRDGSGLVTHLLHVGTFPASLV